LPAESFSSISPVIITISESEPGKLIELVEKVCLTSANLGITSDKGVLDSSSTFSSIYSETKYGARVVYSVKEGWEDVSAAALKKATARALKNATALAEAANLKVGEVIALEDLSDGSQSESGSGSVDPRSVSPSLRSLISNNSEEELSEGDLVRKVRVRVKVAVSK
jgi:hypothetical protein